MGGPEVGRKQGARTSCITQVSFRTLPAGDLFSLLFYFSWILSAFYFRCVFFFIPKVCVFCVLFAFFSTLRTGTRFFLCIFFFFRVLFFFGCWIFRSTMFCASDHVSTPLKTAPSFLGRNTWESISIGSHVFCGKSRIKKSVKKKSAMPPFEKATAPEAEDVPGRGGKERAGSENEA